MRRLLSAMMLMATVFACNSFAENEGIALDKTLQNAPLPDGYVARRQDINDGSKVVATLIHIRKPGTSTRVNISIDYREFQTNKQRAAALKDYLDATLSLFDVTGWKLIDETPPDIRTIDTSERISISLMCEDQDKNPIYAEMNVFFTENGYKVLVFGNDKDDFKQMSDWVATVRAAP